MLGLRYLIAGISYSILEDYEKGVFNFRKCLGVRSDIGPTALDAHVSAFSQYELGMILMRDEQVELIDCLIESHNITSCRIKRKGEAFYRRSATTKATTSSRD